MNFTTAKTTRRYASGINSLFLRIKSGRGRRRFLEDPAFGMVDDVKRPTMSIDFVII